MVIKQLTDKDRNAYNAVVTHPLQSWEWGEFREKTGVKVIRRGLFQNDQLIDGFQLTIHPVPKLPYNIGYLPKGNMPSREVLKELKKIAHEEKCIFIQLEPNIIRSKNQEVSRKEVEQFNSLIRLSPDGGNSGFLIRPSAHPLFTKYTFFLDLTKTEDELLKDMHHKARYNIRVSQKHNVEISEDNSPKAFETYLKLTKETTERQGFYAHTEQYHRQQWETLSHLTPGSQLTSHLLIAKYKGEILATWILFVFKDTLYYPYGASSNLYREVMASNAIMWGAIQFGQKHGLKKFDMWGALGLEADTKDPWFGFHDFKRKYGPDHIEFVGSYDFITQPALYQAYKLADKLRWMYLRIRK